MMKRVTITIDEETIQKLKEFSIEQTKRENLSVAVELLVYFYEKIYKKSA